MVHFPTNKNKTCKFNTMLITPPPPSSEPPPPYSPPRNTNCTSSRQGSNGLSPNTQFPFFPTDLSLAKKARAALNHGPSSAFHPPSKGKILGEPPPYSLTDNVKNNKHRYDMELRDLKTRHLVEKCAEISSEKNHIDSRERDFFLSAGQTLKTPRELYQHAPARLANSNKQTALNITPSNPSKEQNHPQGPLLRTGKSLQIPGSRGTLRHHPHATTHQHPSSAHISDSRERQHRQTYSAQSPQSFNSSLFHQANRGASFETRNYDGSGRNLRYKLPNIVPLGSPPPHAPHIARPYHLQPQGQSARGTLAGTSNSQDSHQRLTHPNFSKSSRDAPRPTNSNHLTLSNSEDNFRSFNNTTASRKHEFYHERGYRDDGHAPRNEFLNRHRYANGSGDNALQNDIPFSDSEDGSRRSHRSRLSRFVEHISRDGAADRDRRLADRRRSAHSRTGRTARLEQEAASSMISARAFPALVTTPRMRSCRSLDELSDLLHEDLERFDGSSFSPLPSIARSLDDLTEPLYMNVPLRSTLPASHSLNTSVPDVLEPPPLPAKPKRGRTISLSPVTIRDEMTSLQAQLEKIKRVAFVLGNKVERGEFTSTLSSNSSRPSQHPTSKQYPSVSQGHNSAFKRIVPSNTNVNSQRLNSQRLDPPGVPSRAPVINDVSFLLNQEASAKFNICDPTASQCSFEADVDAEVNATDYQRYRVFAVNQSPEDVSLSYSRTPDPDSSSHESGYSSTDSRSGATRRPKLSPEELLDFNINAESQSSDELSNPRTHSDRFLERYPHQSTPSRHQPPRRYPLSNVPDVLRRDGPVPPPSGHFSTPPGSAACTLPQQRSSRDTHNSGEYRRVRSTSGSRVDDAFTRNPQQRDQSPVHQSPRHHSMDYLQDNAPRNISNEPRRLSRTHIERFENPKFALGNVFSPHFNTPGPISTHNKLYGSMDQLRADLECSWGSQEAKLQTSDQEPMSMSFTRDPRTFRGEGPRSSQWESKSRDPDRSKLNSRRSCPPELPKKLRNLQISEKEGLNQDQLGIYIKSVVPGGSADQDGRLQAGDQLLSVDGRSLVGISQERAAEYMKRTGPTVVLEVARQGAFYHGLATVLEQPSPQGVRPPIHGVRRSSFSRYEETRPHQLSLLSPASCASSRSLFVPPQSPDQYQERLVEWGEPPAPSRPPRLLPSVPFQLGSPPQPLPGFTIQPQPVTPLQLLRPDSAFPYFETNSNVVPNTYRVQPQVRVNQGTNLLRPERGYLAPPTICASPTPSQEPRPTQCNNNNNLLSPNVAALNLANSKSNPNLATITEGDGTPQESPRDGQEEAPDSGNAREGRLALVCVDGASGSTNKHAYDRANISFRNAALPPNVLTAVDQNNGNAALCNDNNHISNGNCNARLTVHPISPSVPVCSINNVDSNLLSASEHVIAEQYARDTLREDDADAHDNGAETGDEAEESYLETSRRRAANTAASYPRSPSFDRPTRGKGVGSGLSSNRSVSRFSSSADCLDVGIEHRSEEDTRDNPHLPRYTFTPMDSTLAVKVRQARSCWNLSSATQLEKMSYEGVRYPQQAPNYALFGGAVCCSCCSQPCDYQGNRKMKPASRNVKSWKSLGDIVVSAETGHVCCRGTLGQNNTVGFSGQNGEADDDSSYSCKPVIVLRPPKTLKIFEPPPLISRTSYPLLPPKKQFVTANKSAPELAENQNHQNNYNCNSFSEQTYWESYERLPKEHVQNSLSYCDQDRGLHNARAVTYSTPSLFAPCPGNTLSRNDFCSAVSLVSNLSLDSSDDETSSELRRYRSCYQLHVTPTPASPPPPLSPKPLHLRTRSFDQLRKSCFRGEGEEAQHLASDPSLARGSRLQYQRLESHSGKFESSSQESLGAPVRPASERDIPSKLPPHPLLRGPPPAAHLQPRMQPAKSVPALNSELSLSGELSKSTSHDQSLLPHPPPHHPQDIFNPNYSRTSSSNSLTPHHNTLSNSLAPPALSQHPPHLQQHQPPHGSQMLPPPPHQQLSMPLRSRSTQNLSDNDDRHYQNISFHAANPHRSPHAVQPAPQLRDHHAHQPRPASALLQRDEPGRADPSFRPDLYRPASQRDLRPQEPRLVHLPEEGPNGQLPPASMRHPPVHQQSPGGGSGGGFTPTKQAPPPTAPKPKPLDRNGQQPHAFRPPIREEGNGYRDSPPPPPPPTSTHPLLQGSSSNEPTTRQPFFSKTSAWEREEKERYEKRRREAARQWRDEQISQLERQPHKTPQEEERLKTLQLEREFELRAKQADEEEENSEDEDDERITSMAADTRTDEPMIDRRDQAEKEAAVRGGVPRGGPGFLSGVNGGGPADEERAKRADEIRRKQQELEVASEVEQKLLREAQRRQEEEANARRYQQQQYQQFKNNPQQASQRLDSLVGAPANNEFTNGPMNGLRTSNSFEQNFNNGNINPPPPERNSSYNVMQQQQQQHHQYQQQYSSSTNNARLRNPSMESSPPSASNVGTVKRVQFSESHHTSTTSVLDVSSSSTVSFDANANKEDRSPIKYNPNDFINEAENMLNFSPSPIRNPGGAPATPGVIGAQEVYRDPRVKRLQEKQALQAASSNRPPVPETLTFREKMKMFAAETGEPETPKDRTKISRAQREID